MAESVICDFCADKTSDWLGNNYFVEVEFEGDRAVWCGHCLKGSRFYFFGNDSKEIVASVIEATEFLEANPADASTAHENSLYERKVWMDKEIYRAKRELIRRLADGSL